MATDPDDNVTLLFGGESPTTATGGVSSDTWEFANGTWTNLSGSLSVKPPDLGLQTLSWDASDGYFVLFGCDQPVASNSLCETWTFSGTGWKNVTGGTGPSARFAEASAYDAADREVVLFGGILGGWGSYSDTWVFSGGSWTNITATAGTPPAPRGFEGMTYDAHLSGVLLFGGREYPQSIDYNDTWEFTGNRWSELVGPTGPAPSERRGAAFAYDPQLRADVLFGGEDSSYRELSDDWVFTGTAWRNITTSTSGELPGPRWNPGFATGSVASGLLLFGGCTAYACAAVNGETWSYRWNLTGGLSAFPTLANISQVITFYTTVNRPGWVYTYAYSGLPTGCAPANLSSISCLPTGLGRFLPTVTVTTPSVPGLSLALSGPPVTVDSTPMVSLASVPGAVDVGQTLQLTASVLGGTAPFAYTWSGLPPGCGSGDVSSLSCAPTAPGAFLVTVSVKDALEVSGSASAAVSVESSPVVVAGISVLSSCGFPLEVKVSAEAAGGFAPYSYLWRFGDGGSSANSTGNHSFTSAPLGPAVVSVTDALGESANASVTVPLAAPCSPLVAAVAATPLTTCDYPLNVDFVANVTGGRAPYAYSWQFGDGGSSSLAAPQHRYSAPPVGAASVRVTDAENRSITAAAVVPAVVACPSASPAGGLTTTDLVLIGLMVAVVVGAVAAILVTRSRARRPPTP